VFTATEKQWKETMNMTMKKRHSVIVPWRDISSKGNLIKEEELLEKIPLV